MQIMTLENDHHGGRFNMETKTSYSFKDKLNDGSSVQSRRFNPIKYADDSMKVVGQMFPLCNEEDQYSNKLLSRPNFLFKDVTPDVEFDYCPAEDISFGETSCSFGLSYNDHNYGVPTGLTPPSSPPHLREIVETVNHSNHSSHQNSPMKPLPISERVFNVITLPKGGVSVLKNPQLPLKENFSCTSESLNGGRGTDESEAMARISGSEHQSLLINSEELADTIIAGQSCSQNPPMSRWEMGLRGGMDNWNQGQHFSQSTASSYGRALDFGAPYDLQNMLSMTMETEMKVFEVPEELCVSPTQLSDLDSDLEGENTKSIVKRGLPVEDAASRSEVIRASPDGVADLPERAVIRCACGYTHSDGNMIMCRVCTVWQHLDCMNLNVGPPLPSPYTCEICQTRRVDYRRAMEIQRSKLRGERVSESIRNPHVKSSYTAAAARKLLLGDDDPVASLTSEMLDEDNKDNIAIIRPEGVIDVPLSPPRTSKRKQDLTVKAYTPVEDSASQKTEPEGTHQSNYSSTLDLSSNYAASTAERNKWTEADHGVFRPKRKKYIQKPEDDAWTRGQSMDTMANPLGSAWSRDYVEIDQNTYTNSVLDEIAQYGDPTKHCFYSHPPNYLTRAALCKLVIFDNNYKGLEAACRLRVGEMVIEYKGHVQTMAEYERYLDIYHQYNRYAVIYHSLGKKGIVIDSSKFGNEARFIRRSCRPNCKLEIIIVNGCAHLVVSTTHEIMMGGEVTIPFDVEYTSCRYSVDCACGKTRCPVIRWNRKLENHRVMPKLDYKRYIESQLNVKSEFLPNMPNRFELD